VSPQKLSKQMKVTCQLSAIFNCSIERAFKAPIPGDATKFLNGYLLQPPVTAFKEDQTLGEINGSRLPCTNGNLLLSAGVLFTDQILERVENKYWKWTIFNFIPKGLFFLESATGEWKVSITENHSIQTWYSYTFYNNGFFKFVITWIFCKLQWKGMMKKALKGIKQQAESGEVFIYEKRK
jgi:hypothetical protein